MSKPQSKMPSPARSQGAITPRRPRSQRTLSSASPAQSEVRLSTVVERFVKSDKFVLSPMKRRSVLPDDTAIEAPRRASWWKRLEGSSRDVLEALDTNKMTEDLMLEQYEFEVDKDDKQSQSVQQSQSSDNESVASIVVPQRRLFNQKKQTQAKFGDIMGSRKSLGKTNIEDQSIEDAPKNLFNKGPRNKPVFPAALLNSTNKTINKTVEPETNKQTRPNLFGQAGGKRKNMFTDFVMSDSEEDSEVQHKVFGFKKNNNKRISLGTRNRRMPSLTPSMTTEIDIDDWNLLPSSTMIGTQENSRMSDKDMEQVQDENQDDTLTENNASLNRTKETHKSMMQNDENNKTLTNENIEDGTNGQDMKMATNESKKVNKTHNNSQTKLNVSGRKKTSQNKTVKRASNISNADNVETEEVVVMQQQKNANVRLTHNVQSLEDKMAELHGESVEKEESRQKFTSYKTQENICEGTKTTNLPNDYEFIARAQGIGNNSKTAKTTKQNEELCENYKTQELNQSAQGTVTKDGSKELDNINIEEEMETNAEANKIGQEKETEKDTSKQVNVKLGQDQAKEASKSDQGLDFDKSEEEQKSHQSKQASKSNHDENMDESEEEQEVSEMEKEQCEEEKEQSEEEHEQSEEEQNQSEEKQVQSEAEQVVSEEEPEQNEEVEQSLEAQKSQNISKEEVQSEEEQDQSEEEQDQSEEEQNQSEEEQDQSEKEQVKSEAEQVVSEEEPEQTEEVERSLEAQKSQNISDEEVQSEEEQDQSEEEQDQSEEEQNQSEEEQDQNEEEQVQSEAEQVVSEEEPEQTEEEKELSLEAQKSQNISDEVNKDQNMDEDMEKMVWNDNDDEKSNDASEEEIYAEAEENSEVETDRNKTGKNHSHVKQNLDKSRNVTNKSLKIVHASLGNDQMEEDNDVVEETPNNSTQDTTGRNRNKEVSKVKSPEAVLQNVTNDNESFRPIGRSTTFRKSKSVYDTMHIRHSLAPVQESTLGSDGSRNSSTEGSEWDSHRTTRKTIRQTLGKEYTTRKSLRALVMEQSAKRQTELYNKNTSKFDKTTNKTVTVDRNKKDVSKINKTKNKTVIEDSNNKNASTINKTRNKTMTEDAKSDNASKINKTKNKTILEDIDDQHIRFRRTSSRNISNVSPNLRSLGHGNSTHHVPDPLNSETQASYHLIKEPEISRENLTNPEDSVNVPIPENDSGPEISMNASYGQGMTASGQEDLETSDVEMLDTENTSPKFKKENSRRIPSIRSKSINNSDQEVLDYEASEEIISGLEGQEISHHDESMQNDKSEFENEEEIEQSEQEIESEHEDSQQEIEPDLEHEEAEEEEAQEIQEQEQSQEEIESEQESQDIEQEPESEQEIESEHEDSQQEIDPDSKHEETEEEEAQEIEDQEQSQEEIESDQESQDIEQEPESEDQSEPDHNSFRETLNELESEHDVSREPENENSDQEDFILALNSKYKTPERRRVSRIVFDSNMMSVEAIDFEGVSRQTANDIAEDTEREPENDVIENSGRELSRASEKRVGEPIHDVSLAKKKAMFLIRMEEIAQQNMERKQKIRNQIEKSLKATDTSNFHWDYIGLKLPQHCIRRPQVPRKPKSKPKPMGIHAGTLPNAFKEDLKYKPPKRFQRASAPWITKRLYKFLETKLEPRYDYRARVRAEELVQSMFSFSMLVRRRDVAPAQAVDELKREMARLRIVNTHYEFYEFFDEFMPTELILKVKPDMVNRIPMPRNGIFSEILQSSAVVE